MENVNKELFKYLGSKWTLEILTLLRERYGSTEQLRFNEIKFALPEISGRLTVEVLKQGVALGLIKRTAYAETPPRVTYEMTMVGCAVFDHARDMSKYMNTMKRNLKKNKTHPLDK